MAVFDRLLPC